MTPKEKAEELTQKMLDEQSFSEDSYDAKQCALTAVNEIIFQFTDKCCESANRRFWEEVKEEIEKL